MRIPSSFAVHQVSFLRFIAAENILHRTGHYVMNSRCAIGRRRAFIKNECGTVLTDLQTLFKGVPVLPDLLYFPVDPGQVKSFIFRKLCLHFVLRIPIFRKRQR